MIGIAHLHQLCVRQPGDSVGPESVGNFSGYAAGELVDDILFVLYVVPMLMQLGHGNCSAAIR